MSKKFQNKYRSESIRWQHWDYGWDAAYFLTICTKNREHFFGEIVDGEMQLSHVGVIADICWHDIKNHAKNIGLGEYIVMPNHVHGVLILSGNKKPVDAPHVDTPLVDTPHAVYPQHADKTIGQQRFQNQGKNTISSIIGGYKSAVSKHAHRLGFDLIWQSRFHDHVIRDEQSFIRISEYIKNNPSNWKEDTFFIKSCEGLQL